MQCSNCRTENSPRVKFCAECGSPMGIPCPECGFRNARDAQSCGGCSRPLQSAQTSIAERRQLTVFFADIVGSTTIAETLDPEDLHDLYARYQALCAEVVQRYDGHIAQYLGDGVLAYFGYPAAHEDDAQRAVRSGLEILQKIGAISIGDTHPRVRIGIHTGLVVVGDVGAGFRREQLALGEAPNIAARLQSEALPGTLLISHATCNLLGGQFALEDLGSRTLKGLSRPLQVFRVLGKSGAASRFHAMTTVHGLTPFVGREREVDLIRAAWSDAVAGRGRTLLLSGEAGIGKSRLLAAARQAAECDLHELFDAECSPYQMNSPLNPIVEMIGRRLGFEEDISPAGKLDLLEQFAAGREVPPEEATALLAELFSIPTLGRCPEIQHPPAKRRQRTIEILASLLLHSVGGSPILLLIEDLHWADPSTLDLLTLMVANQQTLPVLVVCTARPGFQADWLDRPNCREVVVESLPAGDTRALVARVTGPKPLPPALIEELVARTGGIPLFVEAVTRTVIEAGILRELDDRYELTGPLPPGMIPATVQDSLMGRIDRLGPDRSVAQLAATIGRESSFDLLRTVLGVSTGALTEALKHLVELDLVSVSGTPPVSTYTFKHALIQDAAYESLLRKTRQEFHGKIAEALVHRFPDMAETKPELLARHFEGAGRVAEAMAGWMKAGRQAQQRSAVRECTAYLQRVVVLCNSLPEDDPARLQSEMEAQEGLFNSLTALMGWGAPEVEAACLRARDLCQKLGNGLGLLRALLALSTCYLMRGSARQALETAEAVVEMTRDTNVPELRICVATTLMLARYFLADFQHVPEAADKALAYFSLERERALVATLHVPPCYACKIFTADSLWFMGYTEAAERLQVESLSIIDWLAIPSCTAYALSTVLNLSYSKRDRAQVAVLAQRIKTLGADEGFLVWHAVGRIYGGWSQAMDGDAEAGLAEIKAGLEGYRLTNSALLTPQFSVMLAEAYACAGRSVEALAALSRGLVHCEQFGERVHEPELYRVRGEIQIRLGNSAAGEASLRIAIVTAQGQQAKSLELRAAISLARHWIDQGRIDAARALLIPLETWFQEASNLSELHEARSILSGI